MWLLQNTAPLFGLTPNTVQDPCAGHHHTLLYMVGCPFLPEPPGPWLPLRTLAHVPRHLPHFAPRCYLRPASTCSKHCYCGTHTFHAKTSCATGFPTPYPPTHVHFDPITLPSPHRTVTHPPPHLPFVIFPHLTHTLHAPLHSYIHIPHSVDLLILCLVLPAVPFLPITRRAIQRAVPFATFCPTAHLVYFAFTVYRTRFCWRHFSAFTCLHGSA